MWPLIKFLPVRTNFKYVAYAPVLGALSLLACAASIFLTLTPLQPPCGGLNCGVDFTGGTQMEIHAPLPIDVGRVRESIGEMDVGEVQVQTLDQPTRILLRYEGRDGQNPTAVAEEVRAQITRIVDSAVFEQTDVVGPQVSGELLTKGVLALLAGITLMLVYIWFRFGLTFGIGAVVALTHDVILTFGLFAVLQMDFTLTAIGSILTIIGYSINDKIVVLDRVRENLRRYKQMPMRDLIDLSVNETLSRTIITGVTGIMALGVMVFFGGEALYAFSVAMIFGIIVGTYSSIYVAAPVLLFLGVGRQQGESRAAPTPQSTG